MSNKITIKFKNLRILYYKKEKLWRFVLNTRYIAVSKISFINLLYRAFLNFMRVKFKDLLYKDYERKS